MKRIMLSHITTLLILSICFFMLSNSQRALSQSLGASGDLKWFRVNSLHAYFSEQGAEVELGGISETNNTFSWPADYGLVQSILRSNAIWLGCRNYYSPELERTLACMVVNTGPRPDEYTDNRPMFDADIFKLVGRFDHPLIIVDGAAEILTEQYDVLDEIDQNLFADRMLVVRNHTLMGVTTTKKVFAFTGQDHSNYYIYDYVLKNTGIISEEGDVYPQTLEDFWFSLLFRYAFAGESRPTFFTGWGAWSSTWGANTINDVIGTNPSDTDFELRAHYAYYGPHSERPLPYEDDWGCPNEQEDGVMAAAKFGGVVVLHADTSPDDPSDDPYQPQTTHFIGSDITPTQRASSQYDEAMMLERYEVMTAGHALLTHAEEVGDTYADQWGDDPGGFSSVLGFGPYTLEPGDSVRIVLAHGVAGLSREKNREVGENWVQYYRGVGAPELMMPDGSATNDHSAYKRSWIWTGLDSLLQTFRNAIQNFESGYNIPQPPPPPEVFEVSSGSDRIRLTWADNATASPNFDGYVICRSAGTVMVPETVYEKIFECDASNTVHTYDDTSVVRGYDYYYYIQSKSDGSGNNGVPLYSSKFWTMTSSPAYIRPVIYIYPGDTDNNGTVNELDILPIGVHFLEEATPREVTTFNWAPHEFLVGRDDPAVLYADANGDGTVDEKDVIGIGVNWGSTHNQNTADYTVDPQDSGLLESHREAFEILYHSLSGESEAVQSIKKLLEPIIGINLPEHFTLEQNYPNPFNPETHIRFTLPENQTVTLSVYNVMGQIVMIPILNTGYNAGEHSLSISGNDLESGLYLYRLETELFNSYRKMLVVK